MSLKSWKNLALVLTFYLCFTFTVLVIPRHLRASAQSPNTYAIENIKDVSQSDFYFNALRNMIENYKVYDIFKNLTFRGNNPVTFSDALAGLNRLDEVLLSHSLKQNEKEHKALISKISAMNNDLNQLEENFLDLD